MTKQAILGSMSKIQNYFQENPIQKSDKNDYQNYEYRGIDTVVQAFSKPLADNNVILLVLDTTVKTKSMDVKNTLTRIEGTLRFQSTEDGSFLDRSYTGHSKSSQQKCLEAAKSFAFRGALLETFCVPYERVEPELEADVSEEESKEEEKSLIEDFKEKIASAKDDTEKKQIYEQYNKTAKLMGDKSQQDLIVSYFNEAEAS